MSTLVNRCAGDDGIRRGGLYSGLMDAGLFLSLAPCVEASCPPLKRARLSAPIFVRGVEKNFAVQPKRPCSIDALPDECLFEILRRLPGKQERSVAACVSKRWLLLLSSIRSDESDRESLRKPLFDLNEAAVGDVDVDAGVASESVVEIARCLEGKDATDTRLATMAIKAGSGLTKLSIRSSTTSCQVTDLGLKAVARCCPSLKTLMMWSVPAVGDDGLAEIAEGCSMLEKLDLCQCPLISDKGLMAIAQKCPNLVSLTLESCSRISNEGLQSIGRRCPNLQSISISNCPLVGDEGVSSLISSASASLKKIRLQNLNVSDMAVSVIGYYGREVTDLVLSGLPNVGERGFWVMGNTRGLQNLSNFTATACHGLTDLGLEAVAKGSPNLKQVSIRRCGNLSDNGLKSFSGAAGSLESLRLEECNQISLVGLVGALVHCHAKLTSLAVSKCAGVKDVACCITVLNSCTALRFLSIRNCPSFGASSMALIAKLCPQLQHVDLRGLPGLTDAGLLPLVGTEGESRFVKVNLSGCSNLSDAVVSALTRIHGETLEMLSLEGCKKISDASVFTIAENCSVLDELDISDCGVTDRGIAALTAARQLKLRVLSLSRCPKVSNKSLAFLGNLGKSLVGLNLQHCNLISSSAVGSLEEKMWWCDILS